MKNKFPGIYKACFTVTLDNGGLNRDRPAEQIEVEFDAWMMGVEENEPWDLHAIDAWFTALSDEDMEIATAGEESEMDALMADAPQGATILLNNWFEGPC